jgi:hypothetical protein
MDHHGDLAFVQPKSLGDGGLEDPLDDLDLDEVVSPTEAPELAQTALGGTVADLAEVVDRQSAPVLAALDVFAVPVARFHGCPCARPEDTPELLVISLPDSAGAGARGHAMTKGRHQLP